MKEAKHSRKAKQSISQSSREASCDFGSTINSWVAQRSGRVFLAQSRHDHTWTSSAKLPKRRLEMAGFPNTSSKGAVGRTVISISFRRLRVVCFGRNTIRVDSSVVLINSLEMSREDRWTFAISRTWRDCRPAKDAKGSNRKEPEDRPANPDADLIHHLWHSLGCLLSLSPVGPPPLSDDAQTRTSRSCFSARTVYYPDGAVLFRSSPPPLPPHPARR
ncbi:hypothetical protein IWX91DRAFT_335232 [Phyllosticta citricarpa]